MKHMEDAATAEISRVQIWQWKHHKLSTQDDGVPITESRINALVKDEVARASTKGGRWQIAGKLVEEMLTGPKLDNFLTTVAYPHIVALEGTTPACRL